VIVPSFHVTSPFDATKVYVVVVPLLFWNAV
jgi:hypothetical protein